MANGNIVTLILTSNATCATGNPATSNAITMTVNPNLPVSVSIAANPGSTICARSAESFTGKETNVGWAPFQKRKKKAEKDTNKMILPITLKTAKEKGRNCSIA